MTASLSSTTKGAGVQFNNKLSIPKNNQTNKKPSKSSHTSDARYTVTQ